MEALVTKIAESKLMKKLEEISIKMSGSKLFSSISNGMAGTMGLILIGAMVQVILALGTSVFGMDTEGAVYARLDLVYQTSIGMLSLFMAFNMAYTYARKNGIDPVQAGFTAILCFILVAAPINTVVDAEGTAHTVIETGNLGSVGLFTALIIGLASVRISKFAVDHNWVIKLPDIVPEGILNSFNAIIPIVLNVVIWYGLSLIIDIVSGGLLSLPTLVIAILSIPMNLLVSTPGMFVIIILTQIFWFFGIHGSAVVFAVLLVPMITAFTANAELAAAGQPLQYSPIFLYFAIGVLGGTGNTLPLVVMGLRSKSETIKAVSKAALPTGLFNINEPAIFGFPIMYNAILLIPFMLAPLVPALLMLLAFNLGLISYPQVLILTTLPVAFSEFMNSLDWRNAVFTILMFPIVWLIWYPFFKVYEKKCIADEQAAAEIIAD